MTKATNAQKNIIAYPEVKIKDVLITLWKGIKPQKWWLLTLVTFIILANIVGILTPLLYKNFFDAISSSPRDPQTAGKLISIILYILALNGLMWIFYRIATWAHNNFQPRVIANLKQQAYDYMMLHSYSFFVNNFAGSLVQKVNRFGRAFERIADDLNWNVLPLIVRVISILAIIFFVNKWIALVILAWTMIFLAFNISFSKWKLKYDIKVAEADSKATGYLSDTISNQNPIQLFGGYKYESEGYKKVTEEQARATKTSWNLDAIIEAGQSLLSFSIEFLLFFFTIRYWQQGIVSVGVFVLLQAYIINIIGQLWGFTRLVRNVYQSYADSKEMVEILKLSHDIVDVPTAEDLYVKKGEIEFKELSFAFNETRSVLENINLKINPGEKVALVGPSGAGKTTFIRLLLRLYSPTSGKILIDGQDISKATQESLRKNISMVPQDPILFHRTMAQNIAYGKHGSTIKEIEAAAESAHCDEFIENLPYKFDTYVGERGIKLSGGERQRVAIARAILKNAPILVLDEATSSLDSHSELLIQDALNNLMKEKTTIVIAHRLSTIQKMDRIIVIDQGKIMEQGSHSELLKKKDSLYRKLWRLQAGGFLADDDEVKEDPPDSEGSEKQPEEN